MKKSLILDLDATLIHCDCVESIDDAPIDEYDFTFKLSVLHYLIKKRSNLDIFLLTVVKYFDVYCYTAAMKDYADIVLDKLERDVGQKIFTNRFYNECCVHQQVLTSLYTSCTGYFKYIGALGFDLKSSIVIDDCPDNYRFEFNNVIFIPHLLYDKNNDRLLDIVNFLRTILYVKDVRCDIRIHNVKAYPTIYNNDEIVRSFYLDVNILNKELLGYNVQHTGQIDIQNMKPYYQNVNDYNNIAEPVDNNISLNNIVETDYNNIPLNNNVELDDKINTPLNSVAELDGKIN
jgi:hypothetical protein